MTMIFPLTSCTFNDNKEAITAVSTDYDREPESAWSAESSDDSTAVSVIESVPPSRAESSVEQSHQSSVQSSDDHSVSSQSENLKISKKPVKNGNSADVKKNIKQYSSKILNVSYISQYPNYPTGCEGISAIMVLRTAGVYTTPEIFFSKYLKISSFPFDPAVSYCGNPRDYTGFGCYAPALASAMNKALKPIENYQAYELYRKSLTELCEEYINNDIPVILWASIDMAEMRTSSTWYYHNKKIEWKTPEHCLVLVGYDTDHYYFNDPLRHQNTGYPKSAVENAYYAMGMQAVVVKRYSQK